MATIEENLNRIKNAKNDLITFYNDLGFDVPVGTTIDELKKYIGSSRRLYKIRCYNADKGTECDISYTNYPLPNPIITLPHENANYVLEIESCILGYSFLFGGSTLMHSGFIRNADFVTNEYTINTNTQTFTFNVVISGSSSGNSAYPFGGGANFTDPHLYFQFEEEIEEN